MQIDKTRTGRQGRHVCRHLLKGEYVPPSRSMSLSSRRGRFSLRFVSLYEGLPIAMPISSGRTWSFCMSAGGDKGLICQYFGGGEGSARFGGGPGLSRPMTWAGMLPCLGVLGGEVRLLAS
jgi:hypothetical protein